MKVHTMRAIVAAIGVVTSISAGANQIPSGSSAGVQLVTYDVAGHGQIKVILPNDLTSGEKFSGTVVADPSGNTEADRKKNEGILTGYVVSIGESKAKPGQPLKFLAPVAGVIAFSLLDPGGKAAGSQTLPLRPTAPPAQMGFDMPDIVRPGKPFSVPGPCNGDLSDMNVKIGGSVAPVVAESPWQAVGVCPSNIGTGPQTIELTEGTATSKGETRVVSITLAAQRTLAIGQTTPVDIVISGMQGFDRPSTLMVWNHTPNIVRLNDAEGGVAGNHAHLALSPFGANEATRKISAFTLAALVPGGFQVECELLRGGRCGATTHELDIVGPSKSGNAKDGYSVEWKEVCMLGTCYLEQGHAGDHAYSWKRCKVHADVPHKETFKTQDERDARYREIEKDAKARRAAHGF